MRWSKWRFSNSMATSLEHASGAARSLKLNGEEWFFTPLTGQEWGEYLAWLRDSYMEFVKHHAADLDPADRTRQLDKAFTLGPTLTMNSPEMAAIANEPGGIFRLVRMHLLPRHPDITEKRVAELLNSEELRALALKSIEKTLPKGGEHEQVKKTRTGTRAQKRPRPRRK